MHPGTTDHTKKGLPCLAPLNKAIAASVNLVIHSLHSLFGQGTGVLNFAVGIGI